MAKQRCSQCDKELPVTWSNAANANWEAVCPECAQRDLRKKSFRHRRILDTSVRKKPNLEVQPEPTAPAQPQTTAQVPAQPQTQAHPSCVSQRAHMPMDIELDTDDPILLAAQNETEEAEDEKTVDPLEETTQIRRPKPPPQGPQVRLSF